MSFSLFFSHRVEVEHGDGAAAEEPRAEHGDSEVRRVPDVLQKRVARPAHGLRHKRLMVVAVVLREQAVVMELRGGCDRRAQESWGGGEGGSFQGAI